MASNSIPLPNGAQLAIATTYGPEIVVTATTNATIAIATTSVANTLLDGDYVLVSFPGWGKADNQVHRVIKGSTATTFNLPGLNTTSVSRFPAGGGVGTVRKITAWTQIPKVTAFERTGGDAKSQTSGYLDQDEDVEFLTGSNPERVNFSVSYAPDSPHHAALIAASDSGELQALRLVLKSEATLLWPGQLHYNPSPVTTRDTEMTCAAALARQGGFTRFAKFVAP